MIINADSRFIGLADKSVHMAFSSPPYWNLRLYQNDHRQIGNENLHDCLGWATGKDCGECYVCHIRQVAREVWRVLRRALTRTVKLFNWNWLDNLTPIRRIRRAWEALTQDELMF